MWIWIWTLWGDPGGSRFHSQLCIDSPLCCPKQNDIRTTRLWWHWDHSSRQTEKTNYTWAKWQESLILVWAMQQDKEIPWGGPLSRSRKARSGRSSWGVLTWSESLSQAQQRSIRACSQSAQRQTRIQTLAFQVKTRKLPTDNNTKEETMPKLKSM